MAVSTFQAPPQDQEDERKHRRSLAQAIHRLLGGRSNNVLEVTLEANQAYTDVTDSRIGVNSVAICVPTTANAAAIQTPYRDYTNAVNGSMRLVHASDANTDKSFKVVLVG